MLGAFPVGGVVIVPTNAHLGILSSFSQVSPDPALVTSASFSIYRTGGDSATAYTVTYTVVPDPVNGITSAYLADPTLLLGKSATVPAGQSSVSVSVSFAAHAAPSVDLGGSIVLSGASVGEVIDVSASSFSFAVMHQTVAAGLYDLGSAGNGYTDRWTPQLGSGSGIVITQEASGIVVDCASAGDDQTKTDVSAMLWGKTPLPSGAWKLTFSFTQLDTNTANQSNGIYFQVIPGFTGGRNGSDANPNNWTTAQYQDASLPFQANSGVLDKYGTGLRASIDQDALVLSNNDQLRVHNITNTGAEGNVGGASYAASFVMAPSTVYTVTVEWKPIAGTFTWTRTDPAGSTTTVAIVDPLVATWIGQYLGLHVSAVRKVRISSCDVVSVVDGVVAASFEDDPTQWASDTVQAAQTPVSVNGGSITTLNNTTAGHRYVIGADVNSPSTNITVDGVGTITNPIVIEGDQTVPANYRLLKLGTITINNAAHVYFRNFDLSNTKVNYTGTSHHISFEKYFAYGMRGGCDAPQFGLGVTDGMNDPLRYIRWRYFVYGKAGVTTTSNMIRMWASPQSNYKFPNHPRFMYTYKGRFTNITDTDGFTPIITMCGGNDRDWYRDLQWGIYDNLIDDCNVNVIVEIKDTGVTCARNTYERGVNGFPSYMRNRHSHNDYFGNLFVTRAGSAPVAGLGGVSIRDICRVYNNHAYTLADGAQPTLSSPAGAAADRVTLFCGFLATDLYPVNIGNPPHDYGDCIKGSTENNAYQCKVGGNNMNVLIGFSNGGNGGLPPGGETIPACFNTVPNDPARLDRNKSVTVTSDTDYYGRGFFRLASTGSPVWAGPPAFGTHKGGSTTDYDTSLASDGADITQVPHRWLQSEVGPGAAP